MPDDHESQTSPDAAVMRGVIPYLNFDGQAGAAAEFYGKAFGASDLGRIPSEKPGRFMHVQIEVNGGALMMTDHEGAIAPSQGMHLQLVVGDGDAWWSRAVDAGCEVVMPFEKMFWGDRWGLLRDPFGIHWAIDEPADG
jgi:PhnB protein